MAPIGFQIVSKTIYYINHFFAVETFSPGLFDLLCLILSANGAVIALIYTAKKLSINNIATVLACTMGVILEFTLHMQNGVKWYHCVASFSALTFSFLGVFFINHGLKN